MSFFSTVDVRMMFSIKLFSRTNFNSISTINFFSCLAARKYSKSAVRRNSESSKILNVPVVDRLNAFLIDYALKNRSTTSFITLLEQLNSNTNQRLPFILPYENLGRKNTTDKSDLARGIVTVAHVLPAKDQVILASGFAILDGGLIVTCAHTFYQAARHLSSSQPDHQSQSLIITHEGEVIRVASVESHLSISDLALLRLQQGRTITSLPVDPYPAPISTLLLSYEFVNASLSSISLPQISYSWKPAEVLFYKDRCGQETAPGTYDELSSMVYSHPPTNGSSGGPIVHKDTGSVVGIVRGSEMPFSNRKLVGFAIPSESLFEAFKLPGMPDHLE